MNKFHFIINIDEIADKISLASNVIESRVKTAVEALSVSVHAFIINRASSELSGFKKDFFLGTGEHAKKETQKSTPHPGVDQSARHVRWVKVADSLWVVELDEKVAWIEQGRSPVSMATEDWLLKPGSKGLKTAKDGSKYKAIPFTHTRGGKDLNTDKPALASIINKAFKAQKIPLKKIEKDSSGNPKLGVIHKLQINIPEGGHASMPGIFSRPRSPEEAAATGLKAHGGIHYLKDAVVIQRKNPKGKVVKEAVTFRIVSSKHQAENRWMYPAVKPFGAIPAAYQYAQEEWAQILPKLLEEINQTIGAQ